MSIDGVCYHLYVEVSEKKGEKRGETGDERRMGEGMGGEVKRVLDGATKPIWMLMVECRRDSEGSK